MRVSAWSFLVFFASVQLFTYESFVIKKVKL